MNKLDKKLIYYCLIPTIIFGFIGSYSINKTIKTENKYCPKIQETCKIELKEITTELPLILDVQNKEYGKNKYKTGEYFNHTYTVCQVSTNKTMRIFNFSYIPGHRDCLIGEEFYKMDNSTQFTDCYYNEKLSLKCKISMVCYFTTLMEKIFCTSVFLSYFGLFYFIFFICIYS